MTPSPASAPVFTPQAFGAKAGGRTMDTAAIEGAIDACAAAGGGTVWLAAGTYLTGPLHLQSRVTLHLDAGALILGSRNVADYGVVRLRYSGNDDSLTREALINGADLDDVAITGRGAIDGSGDVWWNALKAVFETPKDRRAKYKEPESEDDVAASPFHRPRLVEFLRCRRVLVEGVTLQNSGFWTLHPIFCEDVRIDGLTVRNPYWSYNTDGINPDSCRRVRISNCLVDVGDDCVTLKAGIGEKAWRAGGPCEDVCITNCTMLAGHGGVVIGSDMSGGVRNVTVSNCIFHGTDMGIRIKSMRGRGGVVENLLVSNVMMEKVPTPLVMNMFYWKPVPPEPVSERTPRVRNVMIGQVFAAGAREAAALRGLPELPISGVRLENVRIEAETGMNISGLADLALRGVRVDCAKGPALTAEGVAGLSIDGEAVDAAKKLEVDRLPRTAHRASG